MREINYLMKNDFISYFMWRQYNIKFKCSDYLFYEKNILIIYNIIRMKKKIDLLFIKKKNVGQVLDVKLERFQGLIFVMYIDLCLFVKWFKCNQF